MERKNKNWCCEIIKNTISLFKPGDNFWNKEGYCDINQRYFLLYFYWERIGLDKKVCENCQKLWQAEKVRLAKEDEGWEKEFEEELKNRKCANCQKDIAIWKYKKFSKEPNDNEEDDDWENKGVLGRSACQKHDDHWCQDDDCANYQRAFCSLECLENNENEEDKKYWLQKATIRDLNQEIWKREKLHKRIFTSCMDCRKETNRWDEEEIENATCPDCSAHLIEQNKKWSEKDKKKKIECYKCGKKKLLGYRKNYYTIYCVDCAKEYWEWRSKHFWFCANDCPQEEKQD